MENEGPKSQEEIKLFDWLSANNVYAGEETMQSLIINSFYDEFEEQFDENDLTPLDEIDLEAAGLGDGFDYKQFEKSDEEEDEAWIERVNYALNNLDKFLAYINENWRFS
jgi:hypothetical protein